jgi:hypothetical protein
MLEAGARSVTGPNVTVRFASAVSVRIADGGCGGFPRGASVVFMTGPFAGTLMLLCGTADACAGLGPAPEVAMPSKILRAAVPLSLRFELATDVSVPRFPSASSRVAGPYVAVCFVDADAFVDVGGTCGICLSGDGPLFKAGTFAEAPALFCGTAAGGALVETRRPLAVF